MDLPGRWVLGISPRCLHVFPLTLKENVFQPSDPVLYLVEECYFDTNCQTLTKVITMSDETETVVTDTTMPAAASGESAPTNGMEAAPGCEAPKPERVIFPKLQAAGGKFRSVPAADGSVHFDVNLVPKIKGVDGKEVPGGAPWPRSLDAEGKPVPLPWEGHSRLTHLALTKDCFDSPQGYFLYRAFEAHEKYLTALDQYTDAVNGVKKDADKAAKKHETVLNGLNEMAATLSDADKAKVADVMALLAKMRATPISA